MQILKTLLERWQGPMPQFFQTIFAICAAIAALSFGCDYFLTELTALGIAPPAWFLKVAGWAASAAALVSKFTVDWKKKQETEALKGFSGMPQASPPPPPTVRKPKWGQQNG